MFIYKYCSKCNKRNHKSNEYCIRCGDQLLNDPKFSKNVFTVTLSLVLLLSSATVFAGKSYFNQRSENNKQNSQVQNVEPKQESTKPEIIQEPAKEEVKSEPTVKTPAKKETVVEPQITPPPAPVVVPVCDEVRKAELLAKYMSDLKKISTEKNGKWEQSSINYLNNLPSLGKDLATKIMNDERSMANMEYDGDKAYLDAMYNLDLKSISCSN